MIVNIYIEDLQPEDRTKEAFEKIVLEYQSLYRKYEKDKANGKDVSKPIPKYDMLLDLIQYNEPVRFQLVSKKERLGA